MSFSSEASESAVRRKWPISSVGAALRSAIIEADAKMADGSHAACQIYAKNPETSHRRIGIQECFGTVADGAKAGLSRRIIAVKIVNFG
jgi:hypothetical protein